MLRVGDLHSLLKLLSSDGNIYWKQVQSDDTGRMKDFFPLCLFHQLPLYSDDKGVYIRCADASCYLREYSYMRSMYYVLLSDRVYRITNRRFCKAETAVLSRGELRQFVEYFAQSITITHVLTVIHSSSFHGRVSSCNSTTHTWSTASSSSWQRATPLRFPFPPSCTPLSSANSRCSPTPSKTTSSPAPHSSPSTTSCTAAATSWPTSPTIGTLPRRRSFSTSRYDYRYECTVVHRPGQGPRRSAQGAGAVPVQCLLLNSMMTRQRRSVTSLHARCDSDAG